MKGFVPGNINVIFNTTNAHTHTQTQLILHILQIADYLYTIFICLTWQK